MRWPLPGYDDDDTGLSDREMPDPSDMHDSDSVDTEPCPHCGLPVYEHAEQCPYCKRYFSWEQTAHGRSIWLIAGVLVCLAIVLLSWLANR